MGSGSAHAVGRVQHAAPSGRFPDRSTSGADSRSLSVLVADGDAPPRSLLVGLLETAGHEVHVVGDGSGALRALSARPFDVVLLALELPGLSGLGVLSALPALHTHAKVLAVASDPAVDAVVQAVKLGAHDVLPRPCEPARLLRSVSRLGSQARAELELAVRGDEEGRGHPGGMIGDSPGLDRVRRLIQRVAPTMAPVLITGETGTGKELVARALHAASSRASRPLVTVNCAVVPSSLLEAELFGHVKGSFTGAVHSRRGLLEDADGGTLFLDEIGTVPIETQVKLLRVLEERRVQRVGANVTTPIDFRLVTATNEDLDGLVRDGAFREDLYFRLNVFPIHVPPLRERVEDLPLLVKHFIDLYSVRYGLEPPRLTGSTLIWMRTYPWPGNVRELKNVIERAVIMQSLEEALESKLSEEALAHPAVEVLGTALEAAWPLERLEREYLLGILERNQWRKTSTADILGVSRRTIHRKLSKYREEGYLHRVPP